MTKKVTGKTSEIKSEFYISKNIKFKNLNWILEHLECGNGGTCTMITVFDSAWGWKVLLVPFWKTY